MPSDIPFSRSLWVAAISRMFARMVLGPAQTVEFLFLENAQQLHLHGRIDVSNLIQKKRSALGKFEAALLACHRTRERIFFVAEQFGFDQRFGAGRRS